MSIRKMFLLIKKDMYLNYSLFVSIIITELLYLFIRFCKSGSNLKILISDFAVFIFLVGNTVSFFIPYNIFNREYRDKTLKILKSLPFTNFYIYFSKLILGYISILFYIVIPSLIFLFYLRIIHPDFSSKHWIYVIIGLFFLFIFEVSFFSFFFACFDKAVFIAGSQIITLLFLVFIFKFESITGSTFMVLFKSRNFIIICEFILYTLPGILVLFVYGGFKIFDKRISYRKF
jgi:ABC-type transport system involved in multi-copper enzyme maturation permease subunit